MGCTVNYREKFGERLREVMKEKKVSHRELERRTGISQPTITRLTRGIISPTFELMNIICEALNVSIDSLIGIDKYEWKTGCVPAEDDLCIVKIRRTWYRDREYFIARYHKGMFWVEQWYDGLTPKEITAWRLFDGFDGVGHC